MDIQKEDFQKLNNILEKLVSFLCGKLPSLYSNPHKRNNINKKLKDIIEDIEKIKVKYE